MNEVGLSAMHPVVVALVTQGQAIRKVMAEVWPDTDLLNVVCFQVAVSAAMLAFVVVLFQDGCFPSKILGAASTLVLPLVCALGEALALHAAIDMITGTLAGRPNKLSLAHLAGVGRQRDTASLRAVDTPTDMRGGPRHASPACETRQDDPLRLANSIATSGAKPFQQVLCLTPVGLFGDVVAAHLTLFQWPGSGLHSFCCPPTGDRTEPLLGILPRGQFLPRYAVVAVLTRLRVHRLNLSKSGDKCPG